MSDGGKGKRGRGKIGASYAHDPRVEERTHTSQKTGALEAKVGGAHGVPTHSLGILGRLVWLSRVWVILCPSYLHDTFLSYFFLLWSEERSAVI